MNAPALEVKGLVGGYGRGRVLHGLDLIVETEQFTVVLGPNGAGKTSFLRALSGKLPQASGYRLLDGVSIDKISTSRLPSMGLIHVPQGRGTFVDMSVSDNLAIGSVNRAKGAELANDLEIVYDLFPILAKRRGQKAGLLSGGEQQMLALGRAFVARPRVLLLDEPSLGLSPLMVKNVYDGLRAYAAETAIAMVIVEQSAEIALQLATDVRLLESGVFTFAGTPEAVRADGILAGAYLGKKLP